MAAEPMFGSAEISQGVRFTGPVAGLAEQGQGPLEVPCGLLVAAEPLLDAAEVTQGSGLPGAVTYLAA